MVAVAQVGVKQCALGAVHVVGDAVSATVEFRAVIRVGEQAVR